MASKDIEKQHFHYKLGLTILISGLILICFYLAKDIIGIFLLAGFLAIGIHPLISFAEKKKIPGFITLFGVYLVLGLMFTVLFVQFIPLVIERLSLLFQELPNAITKITIGFKNFPFTNQLAFLEEFKGSITSQFISYIGESSKTLGTRALAVTKDTFTVFITSFLVIIVSGYLALDSKNIRSGFINLFPKELEKDLNNKINVFYDTVIKMFFGRIMINLTLAIMVLSGLWLLNIERFIGLTILTFFLDFIPFIGSIIAGIIAVIIGLTYSPLIGILVLILYAVGNTIEVYITTPLFLGKESKMHPVVVLLALGIFGSVWGLLGVVIAMPITASVYAVFRK